jgi:integrase
VFGDLSGNRDRIPADIRVAFVAAAVRGNDPDFHRLAQGGFYAGQPYTPDALTCKWHKITKTAGVRPIRLHDARHSCGTALHLRGVPLAVIAKWLGHADAATTARLYAHSQDAALMDAAKSLGGVVTSS